MTPNSATLAPSGAQAKKDSRQTSLAHRYTEVRDMSAELAAPLSPEDCAVQSMPDASPTKWHLAHTTWFFEQFVLTPHAKKYTPFHPKFSYLFNSYYNQVGDRVARPCRGMMTRPGVDEVLAYRRHVDRAVVALLESANRRTLTEIAPLIELGLNHEQQHQELLLTDIKHLLSLNPLEPAYQSTVHAPPPGDIPPMRWLSHEGGLVPIGFGGDGFSYDNEGPRHQTYLQPFAIASRPVTNGEYKQFIDDGGYTRPEFWLDMGWAVVKEKQWSAPFYWRKRNAETVAQNDGEWYEFTLHGAQAIDPNAPVCGISFFEADAFARWAGARLPSEFEWEVVAADATFKGNFLESRRFHPTVARGEKSKATQLFGDVWEWTATQYRPYPGYAPPPGAIGEYNGKFMCNQFVLRGGSCATPTSHIRATYRNFFPPEARWQFSGVRLAKEVQK